MDLIKARRSAARQQRGPSRDNESRFPAAHLCRARVAISASPEKRQPPKATPILRARGGVRSPDPGVRSALFQVLRHQIKIVGPQGYPRPGHRTRAEGCGSREEAQGGVRQVKGRAASQPVGLGQICFLPRKTRETRAPGAPCYLPCCDTSRNV